MKKKRVIKNNKKDKKNEKYFALRFNVDNLFSSYITSINFNMRKNKHNSII